MAGLWRLLAMTATACALGAAAAAAQPAPPACVALRSELARLNAAAGPDPRYRAAVQRQRYELARAQNMARAMHCGGGGFLFGPSPAPECPDVEDRIAAMQQNLRALAGQGGGMVDPRVAARRDDVLAALQQNGCTGGATQPAVAPRRRGLFDFLFGGGGGGGGQEAPPPNGPVTLPEEQAPPQSSTYRTVCVRLGDGFFYPISFATSRANFERDAAICQRTCPGTKAELFAYPNPGGSIADAVSIDGQPYKDLPNAFVYQKKYIAGLSCKPAGETWAQALAGADADLHRTGASAGARGAIDPPARRGGRDAARRVPPPVDDSGVADEAPPPGIGGPDDDVTSAPLAPLH